MGSKVKHQLAKVKKAIVGKPGHTKPESPRHKTALLLFYRARNFHPVELS
jgi:hypothetical protein